MKYFLIIIMFIFISCGAEKEEHIVDQRYVDQCQNDDECRGGEYEMDRCMLVKDFEEDTSRNECTFYECRGWRGIFGNKENVYNYYINLEGICTKKIFIKRTF